MFKMLHQQKHKSETKADDINSVPFSIIFILNNNVLWNGIHLAIRKLRKLDKFILRSSLLDED